MANSVVDPETGCWLWTGGLSTRMRDSANRYPQMSLRINGKHTKVRVHRWVAEAVTGRKLDPIEETIEHICRNTICIRPECFGLASNEDNARARQEHARGKAYGAVIKPLFGENHDEGIFWHYKEPIPF